MLRQRQRINEKSNNPWYYTRFTPSRNFPHRDNYVLISEWRLAVFGLILSLSILTTKILYANRYNLYNLVFEKRLLTYETIITDGEVMFKYAWTTVLKFSWFWFPALCGILTTWFTWLMVYLDSSIPGVQPPSPLSPSKYKMQSGHSFHLNYVFAVVMGLLVFMYMFMNGAKLQL